jgi:hypothetical protein
LPRHAEPAPMRNRFMAVSPARFLAIIEPRWSWIVKPHSPSAPSVLRVRLNQAQARDDRALARSSC